LRGNKVKIRNNLNNGCPKFKTSYTRDLHDLGASKLIPLNILKYHQSKIYYIHMQLKKKFPQKKHTKNILDKFIYKT